MATSISSLPPEIILLIAAAVDPDDLASLRLVSKQWHDISTKLFGLAELRHPRFIISPYSLQGLVDLTAHPVLGPCVQSIEIGTYRMKKYFVNTQPRLEASQANTAALTQFPFEVTGLHVVLLTKALANLHRHGIVPTIGLFEDVVAAGPGEKCLRRGYGYDELYGSVNLLEYGDSRAAQTLIALIKAHNGSGCPISGISVDLQWNSLARQAINRHPGLQQLLKNLLVSSSGELQPGWNLTVTLTERNTPTGSHTLKIHDQDKSLSLNFISIEEYECTEIPQLDQGTYGSLINTIYHQHFEQISLEHCSIDTSVFGLLKAHAKTLRHLSISSCIFYDDEIQDGINLLTTIGHDLALESLVLVDLSYENKHSLISVVGEEVKGESSAGVTTIIEDLVKSVRATNAKMGRTGADDEEQADDQVP
ncbi:hypothetical protein KCU65_g8036, partial [Aureobasidium melanogenum]